MERAGFGQEDFSCTALLRLFPSCIIVHGYHFNSFYDDKTFSYFSQRTCVKIMPTDIMQRKRSWASETTSGRLAYARRERSWYVFFFQGETAGPCISSASPTFTSIASTPPPPPPIFLQNIFPNARWLGTQGSGNPLSHLRLIRGLSTPEDNRTLDMEKGRWIHTTYQGLQGLIGPSADELNFFHWSEMKGSKNFYSIGFPEMVNNVRQKKNPIMLSVCRCNDR